MQQVLHYSALQDRRRVRRARPSPIIAFSGVAQALATRVGIRRVLPAGLAARRAGALVLYTRLPVNGHYFWDLFPAFVVSGIGLALAFVPMSIGALTGVVRVRRGRRVGADQDEPAGRRRHRRRGCNHDRHDVHEALRRRPPRRRAPAGGAALTHGFEITFYVLAALAAVGAIVAFLMIESRPPLAEQAPAEGEVELRAAA